MVDRTSDVTSISVLGHKSAQSCIASMPVASAVVSMPASADDSVLGKFMPADRCLNAIIELDFWFI